MWLHCDVISNRLWCHQHNANRASETQTPCLKIVFLSSCMGPLCHVRMMHVITLTSQWARWRLKSPASGLFTQLFIQVQIKENIKAPRHWPFVQRIHQGPVNSLHKRPVTRKMFSFDDVIMYCHDELFMHSLECYFGVYFQSCKATHETPKFLMSALTVRHSRTHITFYISHSQYHGCWWPDHIRSQSISSDFIDLVCMEWYVCLASVNLQYIPQIGFVTLEVITGTIIMVPSL